VSIKLSQDSWGALLQAAELNLYISGGVLRFLDTESTKAYEDYVATATAQDDTQRKKRLRVNKTAQANLVALKQASEKNTRLMTELQDALDDAQASEKAASVAQHQAEKLREEAEQARSRAELAKETAEQNLDIFQKKTQSALMKSIVTVALAVVVGVGAVTTILYSVALTSDAAESQITLLGNTWSNMFGILLTNSFSIIGTVMGVKYATSESGE
tara:strand:- start:433 stop:1080 length:648 start_codon:yes stop_codon:yes gene_type:complete